MIISIMEFVLGLIISVIALIVSGFGVFYAKKQVDLAKQTKGDTKKLLEKIDQKTDEIKRSAETTEKNVNEQIKTLLKNFDPSVQAQNKMMENLGPALMGQIFSSPAIQDKLANEITKSFGADGDTTER